MRQIGGNRIRCFREGSEAVRRAFHEGGDFLCAFAAELHRHIHQHQGMGRGRRFRGGEQGGKSAQRGAYQDRRTAQSRNQPARVLGERFEAVRPVRGPAALPMAAQINRNRPVALPRRLGYRVAPALPGLPAAVHKQDRHTILGPHGISGDANP